jgi:hypothetical protein
MEKQLRLRRRIDHEEEPELDASNESPIACVDCGKRYPMIVGASNCRCKGCNTRYMRTLGGPDDWHTAGYAQFSRSK